jgi:3'(2'), 5'-bisphosphate nucleotidase
MLEVVNRKKEDIFSIIREAGDEILKVYQGNDFQVEIKSDETPLTLADKRSNKVIVNGLKELFPGVPFLSEESKKTPYQERKGWEYFWLIDPLDGTKEFIKRNGEFSINLALINNGCPIFGILYLPVLGLFYFANKGQGAYKIEMDGRIIKLPLKKRDKHVEGETSKTIRVILSKSHFTWETNDYVEKIKKHYHQIEMISVGSAMKLAYLAEGQADIYPRLAPTMEWDIAAGQIIVEETGSKVVDFYKKKPLFYNKEDLRNPWFVAFRNNIASCVLNIESGCSN